MRMVVYRAKSVGVSNMGGTCNGRVKPLFLLAYTGCSDIPEANGKKQEGRSWAVCVRDHRTALCAVLAKLQPIPFSGKTRMLLNNKI